MVNFQHLTAHKEVAHDAAHRMLFYLSLVLACFWYGFRGAVSISIVLFILHLPHAVSLWEGFAISLGQFHQRVRCFLIVSAFGWAEKERREQKARIKSERLAAAGMAVSQIVNMPEEGGRQDVIEGSMK